MTLRIGDTAPDFRAETTEGTIARPARSGTPLAAASAPPS